MVIPVPAHLRLRKSLTAPLPAPAWPAGVVPMTLVPMTVPGPSPISLHALLVRAYANGGGSVPDFAYWWTRLVEDNEFDPALVLVAFGPEGTPVGLAQCWTSGFIKDLVVAPEHRGRGIGEALLIQCFTVFARRGLSHVDLKVETDNIPARRLYARMGMVPMS